MHEWMKMWMGKRQKWMWKKKRKMSQWINGWNNSINDWVNPSVNEWIHQCWWSISHQISMRTILSSEKKNTNELRNSVHRSVIRSRSWRCVDRFVPFPSDPRRPRTHFPCSSPRGYSLCPPESGRWVVIPRHRLSAPHPTRPRDQTMHFEKGWMEEMMIRAAKNEWKNDGWMEGWINDAYTDGWMNGWMD